MARERWLSTRQYCPLDNPSIAAKRAGRVQTIWCVTSESKAATDPLSHPGICWYRAVCAWWSSPAPSTLHTCHVLGSILLALSDP
jgi:hypothetical protein